MSKYTNLEDVLPLGQPAKLKVSPKKDKETGEHRRASNGSWMYSTNHNGQWFTLFCKDTEKELFDTGVVVAKTNKATSGRVFVNYYWENDIMVQPQNIAASNAPAPSNPNYQTDDKPDWDNIALGKCRTLFAVEAFKLGKKLDEQTAKECNDWAKFCIEGKIASDTPPLPEYQGEEIDVSDLPF